MQTITLAFRLICKFVLFPITLEIVFYNFTSEKGYKKVSMLATVGVFPNCRQYPSCWKNY